MIDQQPRTEQYGLRSGSPDLKSTGPIAFGPDGILFVADNVSATVFALAVDDNSVRHAVPAVEDLDVRLAAYLGCAPEDIIVRDMATNPANGAVYLSLMRGAGADAQPVLVHVGSDGTLNAVSLENISFSSIEIADAPTEEDERTEGRVIPPGEPADQEVEYHGIKMRFSREQLRKTTVTDLAYVDGTLLVAGSSNEEFVSTFRKIPFPFSGSGESTSLEIFHVSHGKYETKSPIRTFIPYEGGKSIVASYTCTPIVHFSLDQLQGTDKVLGRTVAELGNMSTPLDIVSYERDGAEYLLVSNSRRPLMRIAAKDIDGQEALTIPKEPLGIPREELPHEGVLQMGSVDGQVLMLQRDAAGRLHLRSYATETL